MVPAPVDLANLAQAAGVSRCWTNADGDPQEVSADDLVAVLSALGYPAETTADRRHSLGTFAADRQVVPHFISGDAGKTISLPSALHDARSAELELENGERLNLPVRAGRLAAIAYPGYHRIHVHGRDIMLAVAPARCHLPPANSWGPAIQIPALRCKGAFGTLNDVAEAVSLFARAGADLLALSPIHALHPDGGKHFSPYAPSSRQFLNWALGLGLPEKRGSASPELIDWQTALPACLDRLRAEFAKLQPPQRAALRAWADNEGDRLYRHAAFDALALRFGNALPAQWPSGLSGPGPALTAFIAAHRDEIDLHIFGQKLATQALAHAQQSAQADGMAIGLIADLAVGVDPNGSDVWSNPDAYLRGLTIGAPPDPLGPTGQDWGLTAFSPRGLQRQAFTPWIDVLRAVLRHSGGLRIDHVFGLQRLWVIPKGQPSAAGAYLSYPVEDLMRILSLESQRHAALIIGEDLGTLPPGFRERMMERSMLGMSVLWYERDSAGNFAPSGCDARLTVAMTGTHDTPTIAGWWRGRDIDWSERIFADFARTSAAAIRERDRNLFWESIGDGPAPEGEATAEVVDRAISHISQCRSQLVIIPFEDLVGLEEQPNIPGTKDQHPNWRRRYPAPTSELLNVPNVSKRLGTLRGTRTPVAAEENRSPVRRDGRPDI